MANGKSAISTISLIISVITLALVAYLIFMPSGKKTGGRYEVEKKLAGELTDNNLYKAAVAEYEKILDDPDVDIETRANINYLIGKIYFTDLFDYEKAASHYVMARALNPRGSFYDEAGKNLITSLEKMGRMVDAKRELNKAVDIDSVYAAHKGETTVAKIGDMPVFLSDLDEAIQKLPADAQKQYVTPEGKREFLTQYIGRELMYRAAVREGYENDPEIEKEKKDLEKQLLVQKYITDKVLPEVNIDTSDVRNYYLANKSEKYDDKPYDDIKTQVLFDYQQEKAQEAFSEYVSKLAAVEKVQIFDENVK
jgi:tetratricopeptide (TPR) repeat protein